MSIESLIFCKPLRTKFWGLARPSQLVDRIAESTWIGIFTLFGNKICLTQSSSEAKKLVPNLLGQKSTPNLAHLRWKMQQSGTPGIVRLTKLSFMSLCHSDFIVWRVHSILFTLGGSQRMSSALQPTMFVSNCMNPLLESINPEFAI